jgi:hypothetical protein
VSGLAVALAVAAGVAGAVQAATRAAGLVLLGAGAALTLYRSG